jgi:CxxC-x17-CxxC domain-containing protein
MANNEVIFFAETTFRNIRKKFGIKLDDRRRHVYVVGKTGMGKTVLMENMAIQDIQAGRGVGFVDPHGEAAERLLDFVPPNRINDVIYFNPADLEYPIAFNAMEKVSSEYRHLVAAGLMGVFKKIWPDVWSARMEYILNNAILALLEYPGSTLLGVNRMLADPDYRKKVVDKVTDPVVKSFWLQEFARYTQRYEVEATAAIQNKVGQFISAPLIRNIIGQVQSLINMREVMDKGKILIANISKGRIGEDNSRLLGALLITKLQLAAMSRVDIPEEERRDFFLYVDEFQNFATKAFVNILSEARKYRLSLILANQYLAQLEEMTPSGKSSEVRDAIFGNVGTIITFRVGAEDAEYLEKEFIPEFLAADLVNLAKYNIYLKLMIDGIAGRPFSAETLPSLPKLEKSNLEKIIKVSRERYGTPQKKVEDKISRWSGMIKPLEALPVSSQILYDAQCSLCGKWTKIVFPPDGTRPIYCKSCRKKLKREEPGEGAKVEVRESEGQPLSLEEILKKEPVSFSSFRKERKPNKLKKRKEVDLEELKKTLGEALNKKKNNSG